MSTIQADKILAMGAGASEIISVDFGNTLEEAELLTGDPTVTDDAETGDLVITDAQVNESGLLIDGSTAAAGQAIQFRITGGQKGKEYTLRMVCSTTAGRTKHGLQRLKVE